MAPSALTVASAQHRECQIISEFLRRSVHPKAVEVITAAPTAETETFFGALLRTMTWLRTLEKLTEPVDFQAATAASRALLEIAIDLALLLSEPKTSFAKLIAWEESSKLKSAQSIEQFVALKGAPTGADYSPQLRFVASHSARINNLRTQHWPTKKGNPRHPGRWTGRDLSVDAVEATRHFPQGKFDDFYKTRYQELCWSTHGSGLAGVRGLTPENFPALLASALGESSRFAVMIAELVLKNLKVWDEAAARDFDALREARVLGKAEILFADVS